MAFYNEDKVVVKNHLLQSAKRVMGAGKFEGSADVAKNLIEMADKVDGWETEPRPEAKPRENKNRK